MGLKLESPHPTVKGGAGQCAFIVTILTDWTWVNVTDRGFSSWARTVTTTMVRRRIVAIPIPKK